MSLPPETPDSTEGFTNSSNHDPDQNQNHGESYDQQLPPASTEPYPRDGVNQDAQTEHEGSQMGSKNEPDEVDSSGSAFYKKSQADRQQRRNEKRVRKAEKKDRRVKAKQEAKYKKEYEEGMARIVVNGKDGQNEEITNVYYKVENYAIYEVKDSNPVASLKIFINTKSEIDDAYMPRFTAIEAKYIEAKALLYKVENASVARARIANIMGHALSSQETQAPQLFETFFSEINKEFNERIANKLAFLYSNIFICVIASIVSLCMYWNAIHELGYHPYTFGTFTKLAFILTCASIGGAFSLSYKLKKLAMMKGVTRDTYIWYGVERTFIAMSGGFIIFLAISAQLIFTAIVEGKSPRQYLFTILFLSVLAGFSETLVPDLLVTLERKNKESEEQ